MANANLIALLEKLSTKIDLPGLKPEEDGTCLLRFDGSINVEISVDESEPAHLVLFTDLGLVPEGLRARLYPEFLEANALTDGGTIGVMGDAGLAVLSKRELIGGMTSERFETILQNFVNQADELKQRLTEDDATTKEEADSVQRIPDNVQQALDR